MKRRQFLLTAMTMLPVYGLIQAAPARGAASKKALVVYFSRSGNTRTVAQQIHAGLDSDLFEIRTVNPYPDDYDAAGKQAKQEKETGYRPPLIAKIQDLGSYDTVLLGFPIWWSTIPAPVVSFLTENDLSGKTVIPFCTHAGSSWAQSLADIGRLVPRARLAQGISIEGSRTEAARPEIDQWLRRIVQQHRLRSVA